MVVHVEMLAVFSVVEIDCVVDCCIAVVEGDSVAEVEDDDCWTNASAHFLVGQRRHKRALYSDSVVLHFLSWATLALMSCAGCGPERDFEQALGHLGFVYEVLIVLWLATLLKLLTGLTEVDFAV